MTDVRAHLPPRPAPSGSTDWRDLAACRDTDPGPLAEVYADCVDWHKVARLVQRGCPAPLALRIVG